jgi:outer membrane protein
MKPGRTTRNLIAAVGTRIRGRHSGTALFLATGLVLTLAAGSAAAQTLEQALIDAYNSNPQLLAERAHLRSTDELVPQALANWRPTVQATAGAGYEYVNTAIDSLPGLLSLVQSQGTSEAIGMNYDVKLTQPVYRGGRTIWQTAQAEETIEAERAHLVATEQTVFYTVAQAYLDCVRDQDLVDLAAANEKLLRNEFDGVEIQTRAGALTRTDQFQAQAQYTTAVTDRHQAEQNLRASRENFQRAVGYSPAKLPSPTLRLVLPTTREEALRLASTNNANVVSGLMTEDAGRAQVEAIRGQLLPTVSVVADYNWTRANLTISAGGTLIAINRSAMVQVSVPLYEGGSVYSQTRQAEEGVGQLEHQTDDARAAAVQSAAQAWDLMDGARLRLADISKTIEAGKSAAEGMHQEQRVGARSLTDVLLAEASLYASRQAQVTTTHDLALGEFALAQQIGILTAADLKLKVMVYDVDQHYQEVRDKWLGFGSGDKHDGK